MNIRIKRLIGILVSTMIISGSFVFAVPVAASVPGDVQWTAQDIPSITKNVILNGSQIIDIAVGSDGKTVYVAEPANTTYIMKSIDAGQSFDVVVNNYITGAGGGAPKAISIAPDDVSTVAVTDGTRVIITKDGGTTWALLPNPVLGATGVITDIAVAPTRSGTLLGRDYVISIADRVASVNGGARTIQANVTAAPWSTTAGIYNITYLDQAGLASVSSNFTIPANSTAGTTINIQLASGDTGVTAVTVVSVATPANNTDTFTVIAVGEPAVTFGTVSNGTVGTFAPGSTTVNGVLFGDIQIIGDKANWLTVGGIDANRIAGVLDFTSVVVTPNFLGDRCIAAVGTKAAAGTTALFIINTATNTIVNNPAGALVATGVVLLGTGTTTDFQTAVNTASIATSSIALPTNFDATTTSGRRAYVGIASQVGQLDNDVYRVDNDAAKALSAVMGAPVYSVAYNGTVDTGILFMGPRSNTDIKYTTQMTSSSPTWTTTLKGPASAATAPSVVLSVASDYATTNRIFAGTLGAESAFNISNDAGVSFNAESLIDTGTADIGSMRGVTFTTDARTAFINTKDSRNFISVWKSELPLTSTSWSRIFTKPLVNNSSGCSLKLNPVPIPPLSIFFMETTTVNGPIYVSSDGGVSFATRNGPSGVGLKTLSVRDGQTLYYVDAAANVYKSTNAGFFWGTAVATGVAGTPSQGYRIILPKVNTLVIGGATVAISTDDAASFTPLNNGLPGAVPNVGFPIPATGYILSTDTRYADNNTIYATDIGLIGTYNIYRIKTDNTANTWENMGVTVAAPAGGRLAEMTVRSSVLYAVTNQATQGAIRTLYSTDLVGNQNWQALSAGLPVALNSIGAAPGVVLYASDTAGSALYAFNDYLATNKPTLTTPDDNYNDAVNPSGGNGYPTDLKMKPMGTGTGQVDRVDLEIVDKSNGLTGTATIAGAAISPTNPVVTVNGPTAFGVFQPNKSYLWRVRAARTISGQVIDSPWSDARTINVQSGSIVSQQYAGPVLLGPQGGAQDLDPNLVGFAWAPVSGATEYQIIVATDAALTKPVSGTPAKVTIPSFQATGLAYGTTYFWAVVATKPTASVQTVGTFTTMQKPAPLPSVPAGGGPAVQPTIIVQPAPAETPAYIWVVILLGAILVIIVLILIVRTRRDT